MTVHMGNSVLMNRVLNNKIRLVRHYYDEELAKLVTIFLYNYCTIS